MKIFKRKDPNKFLKASWVKVTYTDSGFASQEVILHDVTRIRDSYSERIILDFPDGRQIIKYRVISVERGPYYYLTDDQVRNWKPESERKFAEVTEETIESKPEEKKENKPLFEMH